MKTRTRIIARVGTFGSTENPQTVTRDDLAEIAESFAQMNTAPIILGHSFGAKSPRFGEVTKLQLDGENLVAQVSEHDVLAAAVDAGFYPDVSIGAKRSSETGKLYLHHLAYLGEEPPAIKDLRNQIQTDLQAIAASDKVGTITFPPSSLKLTLSDQGDTMDELAKLKEQLEALQKENAELKEKLSASNDDKSDELQSLKTENETLKKKISEIQEKHPEIVLSDADPQTKLLMDELKKQKREQLAEIAKQKLPPYTNEFVVQLSDALSSNGEIALSDGKKMTAHEMFKNILNAIPTSPFYDEVIELSDADGKQQKQKISASEMMKYL